MPRANRRCTRCGELMPCPHHSGWANSNRRATLPSNWNSTRARILERDPSCQLAYPDTWHTSAGDASCTGTATEVDHVGAPDDHRPHMLRGVCHECHRRRTQAQSAEARQARQLR